MIEGVRKLNGTSKEDEKEKKRRWLQEHKMLQDELLKMKFEMVAEGKRDGKMEVKSPYLESVSERIVSGRTELPSVPTGKSEGGPRGEVPTIPKPPGLAEHIAKILEHESKIKRMKYKMMRDEEESFKRAGEKSPKPVEGAAPTGPSKKIAETKKAALQAEKPAPSPLGVSPPSAPPRPSDAGKEVPGEGTLLKERTSEKSEVFPGVPSPKVVSSSGDEKKEAVAPKKVRKLRVIRKKKIKRKGVS